MKAKFFELLPAVIHREIDTHLTSNESSHLTRASKDFHTASTLPPMPLASRQPMQTFLKHVVRGDREAMQQGLKENSRLLFQRDSVTDSSGREFDSISCFEYALWALDKHLWDDILDCLPRDETGHLTDEGRGIVAELQRQYARVKTTGVTYTLNGMIKTESHYDFALIAALQEQVNAQNAPGDKNWNAIDKQWREGVGGAQLLCPMHVVDEYCSNTPFYPVPTFVTRPIPANGLRKIYNWSSNAWESWRGGVSKLGTDFAIYKADAPPTGAGARAGWGVGELLADLDAITALCRTRTLDFSALEAQLASLMIVDEHPRTGFSR